MYFQEVLGLYSQDVKVAKEYFRCYDMDAEDLTKAALSAIDDWLDEEIVGFEPEVFEPEGGASLFNLIYPVSVLPSKEFLAKCEIGLIEEKFIRFLIL